MDISSNDRSAMMPNYSFPDLVPEKASGSRLWDENGKEYIDFGGGNFMQMTQEREEVQAKTVLVANGYYAVAELVDLHGVEMHTEIS